MANSSVTVDINLISQQAIANARELSASLLDMARSISAAQNSFIGLSRVNEDAQDAFRGVGASARETNTTIRETETTTRGFTSRIVDLSGVLYIAQSAFAAFSSVVSTIGAAFSAVVTPAVDFQTGLAEIKTVAGDINLKEVSKQLLDLSSQFGLTLTDMTKGYYDLVSAGVAVQDAQQALVLSSKLAVTGFTTQEVAVNAVTNVMNAWQLKSEDLAAAGDSLSITIKKGKLTFEEYSSAIGNVSPAAANAGVSLNQTNAAMAALTLGGKSAAESATSLKALIVQLSKPTKEMELAFKAATGQTIAHTFAQGDLVTVMQGLNKATQGNFQTLLKLGFADEAAGAAATLAGKQTESFTAALNEMEASAKTAGAVLDKDFATVASTAGFKIKQSTAQISNLFTELGTLLLPIIAQIASELSSFAAGVKTYFEQNKTAIEGFVLGIVQAVKDISKVFSDGVKFISDYSNIIATLGVTLVSGAVALAAYKTGVMALTLAQTALNAVIGAGGFLGILGAAVNPVTLVIGALALLAGAIYFVTTNTELVNATLSSLYNSGAKALISAVSLMTQAFFGISEGIIIVKAAVEKTFIQIIKIVADSLVVMSGAISQFIDFAKPLANILGPTAASTFDTLKGSIKGFTDSLDSTIVQAYSNSVSDSNKALSDNASAANLAKVTANSLIKSLEEENIATFQGYNSFKNKTAAMNDGSAAMKKLAADQKQATKDLLDNLAIEQKAAKDKAEAEAKAAAASAANASATSKQAKLAEEALAREKKAHEEATKAVEEHAKKIKDLEKSISDMKYQADNLSKKYAIIDTDKELKAIADILGAEKVALALIEQDRLKALAATQKANAKNANEALNADLTLKEAGLVRTRLVTEAQLEGVKKTKKATDDANAASAKAVDAMLKSHVDKTDAIAKKLNDGAIEIDNINAKTANMKSAYRLIDESAELQALASIMGEERVASSVAEQARMRSIGDEAGARQEAERLAADARLQGLSKARSAEGELSTALIGAARDFGTALDVSFRGVSSGLTQIVSGDLLAGMQAAVQGVTDGLLKAFDGIRKLVPEIDAFIKDIFGKWGPVIGEAFIGGISLGLTVFSDGMQTIYAGMKTAFSAISGEFVASFAAGVESVLGGFGSNIESIKKSTAAIDTFGKKDNTEAAKTEATSGKEAIDAINERYKAEVEAARGAGVEMTADRKAQLDTELAGIKAKQDAALLALKREKEAADLLSASNKKEALAQFAADEAKKLSVKGLSDAQKASLKDIAAQQKRDMEDSFAAQALLAKQAYEDKVTAIKLESDAQEELAKNAAANLSEQQRDALKGVEARKKAEIKAQEAVTKANIKSIESNSKDYNIFGDLAKTVKEFVASFVTNMPKIIASFVAGMPAVINEIVMGIPLIISTLVAGLPAIIALLTEAIPVLINAFVASLPVITEAIITSVPIILDTLITQLPIVVTALLTALTEMIPALLPQMIVLISDVIVAIIAKLPELLDAILGVIPLLIAEIPKIITAIVNAIPGIIMVVIDNLPAIINAIILAIPQIIVAIINALPALFVALAVGLVKLLGTIPEILWNFMKESAYLAFDTIALVATMIWEGIKTAAEAVGEFLAWIGLQIWNGLAKAINTAWTWLKSIGVQIWEGFKAGVVGVWDWIKGIGTRIWEGLSEGLSNVGSFFTGQKSSTGIPIIGPIIDEIGSWFANGGLVKGYSSGGRVSGKAFSSGDSERNDTVMAMLSPGELVVPRSAMDGGIAEVMGYVLSQIGSNRQTLASSSLSSASSAPIGMGGVESRLISLEATVREIGFALAKSSMRSANMLSEWDSQGIPETRTI